MRTALYIKEVDMENTVTRKPLNTIKNEARSPAKTTMSAILKKAIGSLSAELLRAELEFICHEYSAVVPALQARLLVQGKDVVRYHTDDSSEDNENSEIDSDEGASESDDGDEAGAESESGKRKPIATADEEYTPRMAMCTNCEEEFDVTSNERGDCVWHPESKSIDYDADFWADHDEDCHGPYEAFIDYPEYAAGFVYECCERGGDDVGCKSTKHKAAVNVVVPAPAPASSHLVAQGKKRKAGQQETLRTDAKKRRW